MLFKVSVVLGLAAAVQCQMSAQQVEQNIDAITTLSSQTNQVAQSISVINFFSSAPQLINNFRQIVTLASNDITAMGGSSSPTKRQECLNVEDIDKCLLDLGEIIEDPSEILGSKRGVEASGSISSRAIASKRQTSPGFSPADQDAICDAFRGFVQVHQQLLATVIGKHGLLSLTPFTQPIAAVLRSLESVVDTLAFGIIDTVPTCAQDATANKNSLDQTLQQALDEYSN